MYVISGGIVISRLLFGGTIPHFFYTTLERTISDEVGHSIAKKLLVERLIYSPLYQAFVIYMIARLEGKTHGSAIKQLERNYWPILQANWKWMSIIQCINLSFVPPIVSYTYVIIAKQKLIIITFLYTV